MAEQPRGQSLVEVAVALPCLCLAVVVTVQIIFSCHNAVLLQRMAYNQARALSSETKTTPAWLTQNPLWGRGAAPIRHMSTEIPQPWRPFCPFTCVETAGHLTTVDMQSFLLPTGGFGRTLTLLNQHGTAEAYIEPPIPQDE